MSIIEEAPQPIMNTLLVVIPYTCKWEMGTEGIQKMALHKRGDTVEVEGVPLFFFS